MSEPAVLPGLFGLLARYSDERSHGVAHVPEWVAFMAVVQDLWHEAQESLWADWLGKNATATTQPDGQVFVTWPYSIREPTFNERTVAWVQSWRDSGR